MAWMRPTPGGLRVLIVDDARSIHSHMHDLLAADGYEDIYHAGSAHEALTFFEAQRPDLVLVDILMPGADGAQLVTEILGRHPAARVVIVTALAAGHPRVVEAVAQGARAVIHKPVESRAFLEALRRVLN